MLSKVKRGETGTEKHVAVEAGKLVVAMAGSGTSLGPPGCVWLRRACMAESYSGLQPASC